MIDRPPTKLSALKLIASSLMTGVVLFTAIVAYLVQARATTPPGSPLLYAGLTAVLGVMAIFGSLVFGGIYVNTVREQWEKRRELPAAGDWLLNQFGVLTIVRLAMLEGFALMGVVGLLITGRWAFIAAALLGVLCMSIFYPTRAKVEAFITRVTGQHPDPTPPR